MGVKSKFMFLFLVQFILPGAAEQVENQKGWKILCCTKPVLQEFIEFSGRTAKTRALEKNTGMVIQISRDLERIIILIKGEERTVNYKITGIADMDWTMYGGVAENYEFGKISGNSIIQLTFRNGENQTEKENGSAILHRAETGPFGIKVDIAECSFEKEAFPK